MTHRRILFGPQLNGRPSWDSVPTRASRAVEQGQDRGSEGPVQFEITPATRDAVQRWIKLAALKSEDFLFASRIHESPHLGTRQYARLLEGWVEELGLDPADYGTHSMRRTKATLKTLDANDKLS